MTQCREKSPVSPAEDAKSDAALTREELEILRRLRGRAATRLEDRPPAELSFPV